MRATVKKTWISGPVPTDLRGNRYGRLVVIEWVSRKPTRWLCACDCGNTKTILATLLAKGNKGTRSCGCLRKEVCAAKVYKHGMNHSKEHMVWDAMKRRCYNKNCKDYPDYGGRGIEVCEEWRDDFLAFYRDMGDRPSGMSIERIDNSMGYSNGNCRWATPHEQNRNMRRNVVLEAFGRKQIQSDWAKETGIGVTAIYDARGRGENFESFLMRKGYRNV
jgi:hypothetical protein